MRDGLLVEADAEAEGGGEFGSGEEAVVVATAATEPVAGSGGKSETGDEDDGDFR